LERRKSGSQGKTKGGKGQGGDAKRSEKALNPSNGQGAPKATRRMTEKDRGKNLIQKILKGSWEQSILNQTALK